MLEQLKLMPNEDGLLVGSSQGAGGASMFSSPPVSSTAPSSSVGFCASSKPLNSSEILFGAKAINYRKGPDGTTYALVVMDSQQAAVAAKQALQTSYKNQQAQWQRFLGEKAQNELEAEMDKMINSEFGAAPQ